MATLHHATKEDALRDSKASSDRHLRSPINKKSCDRICCRFEAVVCHSSNQAKSNINWRDRSLGVGLLFEKASPTCFNPTYEVGDRTCWAALA
ncbi:MAG: hypothetical protein LDL41_16085 [Coleofasciculus sp. S288]|nr:hypothetical protein [Coleofasciculus sp. S288]